MDNLIYIYSVDTSSFYTDEELELEKELRMWKYQKSQLTYFVKPLLKFKTDVNKLMPYESNLENEDIHEKENELEDKIMQFVDENKKYQSLLTDYLVFNNEKYKINENSVISNLQKYINDNIKTIQEELDKLADNFQGIRQLRKDALESKNKISLFESMLTRSLKISKDELSEDIIVVRAYRYKIFEQIIKKGFRNSDGDIYEYFASSAGQIRTKKSCFLRTKALNKNKHEIRNKLMCGLTVKDINKKGGINQNKFQAYLSLTNSSSELWKDFNIDKCIVVNDMELKVRGTVDVIDNKTYTIKRKEDKEVTINFIDGAGMILPTVRDKSFQFRSNYFKGLLIPFDYKSYITEKMKVKDVEVEDIYGTKWNIIEDDIQIIFTKSQFKLHSYYNNWQHYKDCFKQYNCEAAICKVEEDNFDDKPINYQMLQSLSFNFEELESLASKTIDDIVKIGTDRETMLRLIGADEENKKKNDFQKALSLYHQLLNDGYSKQAIKDRKKSLVKEARAGRITIPNTKRTYIAPDLFAFSEWLFEGIKEPDGLLKNGEVSCKLYDEKEINLLRSPHLFREHAVRKNIRSEDTEKWFITNCVHTSVKDMISLQLMFDVDGDDSLIVDNELVISRAKEMMKDIVPLSYEMASAKKSNINKNNIYESLKAAYSKNIGEISNLITKIWATDEPDLELIKLLCMDNNAVIDFAKTLWMPERTTDVKNRISKVNKKKMPYFFKYAKDKTDNQVEQYDSDKGINVCTVNMLEDIIPNNRIMFKKVAGEFDYTKLIKNKDIDLNSKIAKKIIEVYEIEDKKKRKKVSLEMAIVNNIDLRSELNTYKDIRRKLLEVASEEDSYFIADVLVKYLYNNKERLYKDTLWRCFGREIVSSIEYNLHGIKRCINCFVRIKNVNSKKYCSVCAKKEKNKMNLKYIKLKKRLN